MSIYADSSFVVSVYLRDAHTPKSLLRMATRPLIWITPFHEVEFAHAIAQSLFRRRISAPVAHEIRQQFAADLDSETWVRTAFPSAGFQAGVVLAELYVAATGTRTLDTLHVAAALELGATDFWSYDDRQKKLASVVGLGAT